MTNYEKKFTITGIDLARLPNYIEVTTLTYNNELVYVTPLDLSADTSLQKDLCTCAVCDHVVFTEQATFNDELSQWYCEKCSRPLEYSKHLNMMVDPYHTRFYTCNGNNDYYRRDEGTYTVDDDKWYSNEWLEEYGYYYEGDWYAREPRVIKIHGYHDWNGTYALVGDGNKFFGVELEIDGGGTNEENAYTILNKQQKYFHVEYDGSLDKGMEIISQPMTYKEHLKRDWEYILDTADRLGYIDGAQTSGIHIHVNRDYLTDNAIVRIIEFMHFQYDALFKLAGRSKSGYCEDWDSNLFDGETQTIQDDLYIEEFMDIVCDDRYKALNIQNGNTIEFRIFNSTLTYSKFLAYLQLVDVMTTLALHNTLTWSIIELEATNKKYTQLLELLTTENLI